MTKTKKIFAVLLAALMMLAVLPVASFAASSTEAKKLAMLDEAWKPIEAVEKEMTAMKASAAETAAAAYKAALNNPLVDEDSLVWEGNEQFAFTVDGMHCVYCYRVRNTKHISSVTDDMLNDVIEYAAKGNNCGAAGSANVLLIGPNYNESCTVAGYYDSSFTNQYMTESDSIASATGGTCTKLGGHNATGPAIAQNYLNKGVVIYDSHGVQSGTSSYLCLTTNTGITSTDYNNGWAVSSGSEAFIDGRYIQNHVSGTLSNCFVWMAICEGMKKAGKGTTGTALLAAGAGGVYGYSQSVTFSGDYKYEKTFWTQMKNGATVKDAIATMKSTHGNWDPAYSSSSGAAWPIVMSSVDSFPSNPDGTQTVNCDWELFGTNEPEPITSVSLANMTVITGNTAAANLTVNPSNADYTVQSYTSSNTGVATVTNAGVVTGVRAGTATLTATVKDNLNNNIHTATATVTVEDFEGFMLTSDLQVGGKYVITSGNYAAKNTTYNTTNNHYVSVQSITVNSDNTITLPSSVDPNTVLWEIESGNASAGWVFKNVANGKYFTLGSDEYLCVGTNPLAWLYDGADMNNQIDSEGYYYLALGSSNTYFTTSKNTNGLIKLYQYITGSSTPVTYTVTFKDWNGTVLSTQTVEEGSAAVAPTVPVRTGYTFTGWDVDFSNVQSDLVVTAQYTVNSYTLTINYVNEDEDVVAPAYVASIPYGQSYSVTSPVIEGYTTDQLVVSGTMPAADHTITVYYAADEVPVEPDLPGDVDCNGIVDMSDVSMLFSYLNGGVDLSAVGAANADVNGDGSISVMDISAIYGIIANS